MLLRQYNLLYWEKSIKEIEAIIIIFTHQIFYVNVVIAIIWDIVNIVILKHKKWVLKLKIHTKKKLLECFKQQPETHSRSYYFQKRGSWMLVVLIQTKAE